MTILIGSVGLCLLLVGIIGLIIYNYEDTSRLPEPEDTLYAYAECLQNGNYGQIYGLLDEDSRSRVTEGELVERYRNIYGGIEAVNIKLAVDTVFTEEERENHKDKKPVIMHYTIAMDTLAGPLAIPSSTVLTYSEESNTYQMIWKVSEIFPGLKPEQKVQVDAVYGERGNIYDAYLNPLAYQGKAWSVGIVPGKLGKPREKALQEVVAVLDMSVSKIEKAISYRKL